MQATTQPTDATRVGRQVLVIGPHWWWLPALVLVLGFLSSWYFDRIGHGMPTAKNVPLMISAMFSTGYVLVVLLSPGFRFYHLLAAILPQLSTPYFFSLVDSGYEAWLTAQLITTGCLFIIHRIVAIPSWCHAGYRGGMHHTVTIRVLMVLTLVSAASIAGIQTTGFDADYFTIVAALCGPPLLGWFIALMMARRSARENVVMVASAAVLIVAATVLEAKQMFRWGYGEVEPLAMLAGCCSVMVVIGLLNLVFLWTNRRGVEDLSDSRIAGGDHSVSP